MIRKQLVTIVIAVTMILAPLQVAAKTSTKSGKGSWLSDAVVVGLIGGASLITGVVLVATAPGDANNGGWLLRGITTGQMVGGGAIGMGTLFLLAGAFIAIADDDDVDEIDAACTAECEQEAYSCHHRTQWHLYDAKRVRSPCDRARRACRQRCGAPQWESTPAPSPASGPSIRPASAPTTKPAMQPSTPPSPVDEPGLHVSLTPFVAPSPSGDTRYGLAVVGRF